MLRGTSTLAAVTAGSLALLSARPAAAEEPAAIPRATPAPPVKVVPEDGAGPYYYRDARPVFGGGIRLSSGLDMRLGIGDEPAKVAYGLDVLGVGRLGFGRGPKVPALWPEAGYSFIGSDWHLLGVGLGPALQARDGVSLGLVPRMLYGVAGGREARGLRTCALIDFTLGQAGFGFEVAHQYVVWGDHNVHEIRLALSSALVWGRGGSP